MGTASIFGAEIEPSSWADFQSESFQLESFRTYDFKTAMAGQLEALISRKNVSLRYLPLVDRFCKDLAAQYVRRPARSWPGMSQSTQSKLASIYRQSRVDSVMLEAQQMAQAQNQTLILVEPTGDPRRFKMTPFVAGEYAVRSRDLLARSIRDVEELVVRVPVRRRESADLQLRGLYGDVQGFDVVTEYCWRHYTRDRAWVEYSDGSSRGLYTESGENPWGIIPAVVVRLSTPRKGYFHAALSQDLNSVQIGLIVCLSDAEHIARIRTPGREVLTGTGAGAATAKKLPAGPESAWVIPGDVQYQAVAPTPPIDKYIAACKTTVQLLATYRYVASDGLWSSTGITGVAKEAERAEVVENRLRQEMVWGDGEDELAMVFAGLTSRDPDPVPVDLETEVAYHYHQARGNALQDAQAALVRMFLGLESARDTVAETEGVSRDRAIQIMDDRLQEVGDLMERWRSLGTTSPPGLDTIPKSLGLDGGPAGA